MRPNLKVDMKKTGLLLTALVLIMNVLVAQAPTRLHVNLRNNTFQRVNLVNSYGSSQQTFAQADIAGDQFTMNVTLPEDIYRLDFGNGSSMLVVLKPGENINVTVDAEELQQILEVTGSETMQFVKEMSGYVIKRKSSLDSINQELQKDQDKVYWSDFAQKFNLYRQTNQDVDEYLIAAYNNMDTLYAALSQCIINGKVKGDVVTCADMANKMMKKAEINYNPFANYQDNVERYYTFPDQKMPNSSDFYALFNKYQSDLKTRHQIAENSLGKVMPVVKSLLAERDSLAYNNLWDKKSNQTKWLTKVATELYPELPQVIAQKAEYQKYMQTEKATANTLVNQSQDKLKQVVAKYQQAYNEIDAYLTSRLKDEIKTHKQDVGVLMFLDMFPREQNTALHNEVIAALHEKYPEHLIVKERWNYMNSPAARVAIGAMAPELEFPDPTGKMRKLSDLRGKVVLIDFWASWCGPCRRENPNVTRIYSEYHDKGFEIFSVSLDSDAASWMRAIEADKLVWPNHVSDLKKWQSQAAAIYGVRSIPSTFLLDKEGRIVQRDLRGADLERAVKQLVEQ